MQGTSGFNQWKSHLEQGVKGPKKKKNESGLVKRRKLVKERHQARNEKQRHSGQAGK